MTDQPNSDQTEIEIIRAKDKFEYFFLAVIIGLLSLSVQSYNINENYHSNYLVIGTWILLIISFFTGFIKQWLLIKFIESDQHKLKQAYFKPLNSLFFTQFVSFYMAIIFYVLFKINNLYCLSFGVEIGILIFVFVIGLFVIIICENKIKNIGKNV